MRVLVINSGSSSIKYRLFEMTDGAELASGVLERIGGANSRLVYRTDTHRGERIAELSAASHREGWRHIAATLRADGQLADNRPLFGIGHRVVHGGEAFREPVIIDDRVVGVIRELSALAPLHNPANLMGIAAAMETAPEVPQVAVFDTAFHQSIGPAAYHYALPRDIAAANGIRRYGFHGTSHAFVARQAAAFLGRPLTQCNLITLHLGNGASMAAIRGGRCIDTSMGMTPMEGLIMGTRSGDLDPGALLHLLRNMSGDVDAVDDLLNRRSGLVGICGENDMREVLRMAAAGDERAVLAVDMVIHRIKKYIGAYHAITGGAHALVFTGGIGENAAEIRRRACEGLSHLGIGVDPKINRVRPHDILPIHTADSPVKILVVRTNEELAIARLTADCIQGQQHLP
jgi:acetate kinase